MFSNEDKELYKYASKICFQWAINFVAIIVIATLLKMVKECAILLLSFSALRKFSGGYHCQKYIKCFLSSVAILSFGLCLIKAERPGKTVITIMLFFSAIEIMCFSPVQNKNKPLSNSEKSHYRKISLCILLLLIVTLKILDNHSNSDFFYSISFGIIINGLMLLIAKTDELLKRRKI